MTQQIQSIPDQLVLQIRPKQVPLQSDGSESAILTRLAGNSVILLHLQQLRILMNSMSHEGASNGIWSFQMMQVTAMFRIEETITQGINCVHRL